MVDVRWLMRFQQILEDRMQTEEGQLMKPEEPQPRPLWEGSSTQMTAYSSVEPQRASNKEVLKSHGGQERREREGITEDSHRCSTTYHGLLSR